MRGKASHIALEEEVRIAEQRYRQLVETTKAILWRADARTFQFTYISPHVEAMLGYPVSRWIEERTFWQDHLHPEDSIWTLNFCSRATAEKRDHEFDYRMVAADGRVVSIRDLVHVVVEDDVATELFGVMIDITEQKRAEEALRVSEEHHRALLEHLPVGVYQTTLDGRFIKANSATVRLFGVADVQALQQHNVKTFFVDPADREHYAHQLQTEGTVIAEFEMQRAGGERIQVSDYARVVRNAAADILYFEGILVDVTGRKKAEEERERLIRELEARNTELERFTYTVSHDLKTPLVTIKGFLGHLKKDALAGNSEAMERDVAYINEAVDTMNRLLHDGRSGCAAYRDRDAAR